MGELEGKVALVTGGARGLGAAVADVFAREGASVVLSDVSQGEGRQVVDRLAGDHRFVALDVRDEAQWRRALEVVLDAFGRLDVLVNNAGLVGVLPFAQTSPDRWAGLVDVMQTGPYLGLRTVLPVMVAAGEGAVVNVASINAVRGRTEAVAYTTAKHGLLGLTRALALEYAGTGVRINAVCPGGMRTPMLELAVGGADDVEAYGRRSPIGRLSDPHEVAEVVSFLASPRASYCVGSVVVVDGGVTVGFP